MPKNSQPPSFRLTYSQNTYCSVVTLINLSQLALPCILPLWLQMDASFKWTYLLSDRIWFLDPHHFVKSQIKDTNRIRMMENAIQPPKRSSWTLQERSRILYSMEIFRITLCLITSCEREGDIVDLINFTPNRIITNKINPSRILRVTQH